jgi:hypothetical protein
MRERDAEFYSRLEKAGFMLDWGDDGSGLFMKYLRRGSGYYIDVGACDLIIDGSIKLQERRRRQTADGDSVVLSDGSELPADLVVYATGYGSMNGWAADLISKEVASKVGKVWGLGSEHHQGPRPLGRRAAQHVEADPAGSALVPRRQPAPVAALLAVSVAAAEGRGRWACRCRSTVCNRCTTRASAPSRGRPARRRTSAALSAPRRARPRPPLRSPAPPRRTLPPAPRRPP